MPYLLGVLTGILLTILVVFIIDHVGDDPASRDIVNWGFVGEKVGASVEQAGEEIRQEVQEATKPGSDGNDTIPPSPPSTGGQ
jgi:hypothetical protein